jgi:hypothetical protein
LVVVEMSAQRMMVWQTVAMGMSVQLAMGALGL